jgi:hypothetical protein
VIVIGSEAMNIIDDRDAMSDDNRSEVERNFAVFRQRLPELLTTHQGKYALMHRGGIVDFFDTLSDAVRVGQDKFGGVDNFSIQEVVSRNVNLGYYAHAVRDISN